MINSVSYSPPFCLAAIRKRSKTSGVMITQYLVNMPEGKSTPDFQCKPVAVTIEKGGCFTLYLTIKTDALVKDIVAFGFSNIFHIIKQKTCLLGKLAVFKAVVTGDPKPDVSWRSSKGTLSDTEKFQTKYDESTEEHILEVSE